MMVTIFRVETVDGVGPYSCRSEPEAFSDEAQEDLQSMSFSHTTYLHPTPCQSGLAFNYGRDRCGFASLSDLVAWFSPSERRMMHGHGLSVSVYVLDAIDVKFGDRQCAFDGRVIGSPSMRFPLVPDAPAI